LETVARREPPFRLESLGIPVEDLGDPGSKSLGIFLFAIA